MPRYADTIAEAEALAARAGLSEDEREAVETWLSYDAEAERLCGEIWRSIAGADAAFASFMTQRLPKRLWSATRKACQAAPRMGPAFNQRQRPARPVPPAQPVDDSGSWISRAHLKGVHAMETIADVVEHLRRFDGKTFEFRSDLDNEGNPTIVCHHWGDRCILMPIATASAVADEVRSFNPDRADQICECVEQAKRYSLRASPESLTSALQLRS